MGYITEEAWFDSWEGHEIFFFSSKGKAIPLQAWTSPECSRRLKLPDFKTIGTLRW